MLQAACVQSNPVVDKLTYEVPAASAYRIEVKRADGTTFHASKGQGGGTQTSDASAWSRGTYYVGSCQWQGENNAGNSDIQPVSTKPPVVLYTGGV